MAATELERVTFDKVAWRRLVHSIDDCRSRATAKVTFITNNTTEFARASGLRCRDWTR